MPPDSGPVSTDVIAELHAAIGSGLKTGDAIEPRYMGDWLVPAPPEDKPIAVACPRTTEEVSAVLRICHKHRQIVVPQGGLTGLAGGGTPVKGCVAISLERMRAIEEVDTVACTITVQAGVPLQAIQERAEEAGLFYGVDLGGRGSAVAGGNVSTNAGGNRVLRYGMTREQVIGIEVVLADGTVITTLNKMLKNNAGYDLKQLFIGSEGTLGVITRVVLRLRPKSQSQSMAFLGLKDYAGVLDVLQRARSQLGDTLSAFEFMSPEFYHLGTEALKRRGPLPPSHAFYVLMEVMGGNQAEDDARLETLIEGALRDEIVADAVMSRSQRDNGDFWRVRDCPGEWAQTWFWPQISFDISIPNAKFGEFMPECRKRLLAKWPNAHLVYFGHVADSNLHLSVRIDQDPQPVHAVDEVVFDCVRDWGGASISAEHGIGMAKREFLHYCRTPAEIALMKTVKAALDPLGILNPGKVI